MNRLLPQLLCFGMFLGGFSWAAERGEKAASRKNLLRLHLGARGIQGASALELRDDPSVWSEVNKGPQMWVVDLGQVRVVDRISFQHRELSGKMSFQLAATLQQARWQTLGESWLSRSKSTVRVSLKPTAGRYLRIAHMAGSGGAIRGLGVFGPMTTGDFQPISEDAITADPADGGGDPLDFSLTNGVSRARIVSVSPGRGASHFLRDEDVSTSYVFFGGGSPPMFVLDLGLKVSGLGRVVILHEEGVRGAWIVSPADETDDSEPRRQKAKNGATAFESLDFSARRLRFQWDGEVPSEGFAVGEIAVFTQDGLPKSEMGQHRLFQFTGNGLGVPGPSDLPTGGGNRLSFGLPEISPQSR